LIPILVFFLIALAVLFLGHYFVYASILYFFGAVAFAHRTALAWLLVLLFVSFVGSAFLAHWKDGRVTRVFYFCSSLWLGVGLTLLTSFAVAWPVWGVVTFSGMGPSRAWIGAAAVGCTVLYSAYGIVNAYYPRVVHLPVRIRNLPVQWQGKTVVHLSDIHLGRILGARFLARCVAKVNAAGPAMVAITGDLFDGTDGNLAELVAPLHRLVAPRGIYFVTGNHETYLGVERAYAALRTTPVRVLANEIVKIDGLQVVGMGFPERGQTASFAERLAALAGFDPTIPSVLLYHHPNQVAAAKAAGISLQLSGHVHQGQLFPLQFITRLMFGKYYHGLHAEGDFTLYTSSGTGVWGPTMRTGNHPEIVVLHLERAA
jgi:hypothetical protein